MFDVASSLTDRDRHILRLIRWHRVLTTSQVVMMFFSDRNTVQHRMTRLYELRLVERFRPPHAGREAEYHYVLELSIATSQRLAHTVGTNDLFVRLVATAKRPTPPSASCSSGVSPEPSLSDASCSTPTTAGLSTCQRYGPSRPASAPTSPPRATGSPTSTRTWANGRRSSISPSPYGTRVGTEGLEPSLWAV
jgi:hypothetical protein